MQPTLRPDKDVPLKNVRPNIVQSIRAFRVDDLQAAANELGQHFLYANLAQTQSKQEVLDAIAQQFTFPAHFGKNFDALYDCMTDPLHKSGPQPGFDRIGHYSATAADSVTRTSAGLIGGTGSTNRCGARITTPWMRAAARPSGFHA